MEVKDFIENVLVDIAEGMDSARKKVANKIAINPSSVDGKYTVEKDFITFDIAVAVNESAKKNKNKKGAIKVMNIGGDIAKEDSHESKSEIVSRINFRVPVYYGATFGKK